MCRRLTEAIGAIITVTPSGPYWEENTLPAWSLSVTHPHSVKHTSILDCRIFAAHEAIKGKCLSEKQVAKYLSGSYKGQLTGKKKKFETGI